jgi:hypothetical protein
MKALYASFYVKIINIKRYNFSPVDGRDDDKDDIVGQQLLPDELPQRRSPPATEAMHRGENHIN